MNREDLRGRVRTRVKLESDDTGAESRINAALQDAYDEVNGHRKWKMLQETQTESVTDSSTTVDVDTDWGTIDLVAVINSAGAVRTLDYITWAEQLAKFGDPSELTRDTPSNYILQGAADGVLGARKFQMILVPYPDATFTVRTVGQKRPAALDGDTDVPWFDGRFHGLLADLATADILEADGRAEQGRIDRIRSRGMRRLKEMALFMPTGITPISSIPFVTPR